VITQHEYKKRREHLADSLKKNSLALLLGAAHQTRSNDTEYPYRQESNFYYLSGFKEDHSAMMFVRGKKKVRSYLFVAKKERESELWHGKRLGATEASKIYSFDAVYEYEDLERIFKESLEDKSTFYYDFADTRQEMGHFVSLTERFYRRENIAKEIQKVRLIKSDAEIALIQKALTITQEAHHRAMALAPHLENEHELLAEIEYVFKKRGAYSDAYTSIVASANAANTLHYINNDKPIQKDALILIDAGCEYEYYASDITRTIPASAKFSEAQKEIYSLVLSVQKEIIKMIRPGVLRSELHKHSEELLCEGMVALEILKGEPKKLLKKKKHKRYYPHGIGHWLGIDVHDPAPYKTKKSKEIPLKEGMVLTIEPGLYLDKDDKKVPKKYRGIGVRIEDNILVVAGGCRNLSEGIAKEIEEIEKLGASR